MYTKACQRLSLLLACQRILLLLILACQRILLLLRLLFLWLLFLV
jgi:hypothetical protein